MKTTIHLFQNVNGNLATSKRTRQPDFNPNAWLWATNKKGEFYPRRLITYDDFIELFKPRKNHIDKNASFNGWAFETYGKEYEHIRKTVGDSETFKNVWTIIEAEGKLYLTNGCHVVNRLNHMLTSVPFEGKWIEIPIN